MDFATMSGIAIPTALFTAGVAWGAVKQSLNGTRAATRETRDMVTQIVERQAGMQSRVAALEVKTDLVLDLIRNPHGR